MTHFCVVKLFRKSKMTAESGLAGSESGFVVITCISIRSWVERDEKGVTAGLALLAEVRTPTAVMADIGRILADLLFAACRVMATK